MEELGRVDTRLLNYQVPLALPHPAGLHLVHVCLASWHSPTPTPACDIIRRELQAVGKAGRNPRAVSSKLYLSFVHDHVCHTCLGLCHLGTHPRPNGQSLLFGSLARSPKESQYLGRVWGQCTLPFVVERTASVSPGRPCSGCQCIWESGPSPTPQV